jgi:hypothetical protein
MLIKYKLLTHFTGLFMQYTQKKLIHLSPQNETVDVAQSVRASDCGSEGRRFEPGLPPFFKGFKVN